MPAGKELIENVARALQPDDWMFPIDIEAMLPEPKPSKRAIRYAVTELIKQGRAKRRFRRGDLALGPIKAVVAVPEQQAAE